MIEEVLKDINSLLPKFRKAISEGEQELRKNLSSEDYKDTKKFMSDYMRLIKENRAVEAEALKQKFERNGNKL